MAVQDYKINYKSDFVLTINGDAGWATQFCIKFWTGMPSQAYFVGFDGVKYVNCRVGDTPTQLLVMFDDHHLPIGKLKMQIAYHTTIEEFPGSVFDEVTNARDVIVTIDGTDYQVLLDFTGEDAPELEFDLPAYANEAERIQNELQRQQNEADRIAAELQREQATAAAVAGAENVNAQLNGTTLTVTNRQGVSTSVNTKGEQGEQGPVGPQGETGETGPRGTSIVSFTQKSTTATTLIYTVTFSDGTTQDVAIPKGAKGDTGATGPQGPQGDTGVSITAFTYASETETDMIYTVTFSDSTTQQVAIPKGEKGDTGEQGPVGPQGPQGPMGDVAVITPEQQAAFTMYSTTGQNTNGPMTQKAVTDALGNMQVALDEIAEEIVISESELINYTRIENFVFNASQSRYGANNNYVTKYIPVKKGCIYRGTFQCSSSSEYWATAAFATSLPSAGVSGVRVASVSSKSNNTATYEYKAEEDGYLTISHSDTTTYTFITTFTLIGSALKDKVVIDSERIDEINDVINSEIINYTRIEKFVFNASTSKYGSNNSYVTKYIPVKAGKKYNISFKCSASSDYWATIAFATSLPAANVDGTLLHQYSSKNNNTATYLYSATTDGYLTISHSNTTSYTFTTVFTESAEGVDAYAKAKLIVTGNDVVLIYRLWPLKIVIPKSSYVIYEDKCVLLSDYYSANIELSLSGLQSDVIKVVYDSSTHSVYRKDVASAMSAFEHELFTVDFTSGRVSLEEGTYRYNGLQTTQPTARTYYGKKIEFTGEQLYGYTALNFGYPVLNGNDYNDGQNSNPMNGIAIYGNEMFVLYQKGWIQVYDITNILNVTLKGSFQLESAMEHPNTAQFAPTVREGETYPLLYVASGVNSPYTEVEQIRYSNGEYTSENVQRINLTGYGSHPLMNTIIGDDGYFWAIGSKGATNDTFYYYKFNLPSLEQATVNVDCSSAIESWTDSKTYASEPKVQGLCIHQGKSFQVLGALEGVNEIHVTDLSTHEVMTDIVLTDYDYSNMQGCAVYKGTLIISRNSCKGFTMLVF